MAAAAASDREREQELALIRGADVTLVVSPVEKQLLGPARAGRAHRRRCRTSTT